MKPDRKAEADRAALNAVHQMRDVRAAKAYAERLAACCEHDYRYATEIMQMMGGIDIEKSIAFFQEHGGFCDCEICFNINPGDLEREAVGKH